MPNVTLRQDGSIARLLLDRPEALNAFDPPMLADLGAALEACVDDAIRVVVLSGNGRAFSAGGDVRLFAAALEGDPARQIRELALQMHEQAILPIRRLPKPVIASINGTAAGGGLSLALACDLRIAAEDARLTLAYSNIGLAADGGSSYALPRLVGAARAAELLFFSEILDGRRAAELGLVNRAVPAADLESATAEWATRLAAHPAGSLAEIKALLAHSLGNDLETQLTAEVAAMARQAGGADFREGVSAFLAKRPPNFGGKLL